MCVSAANLPLSFYGLGGRGSGSATSRRPRGAWIGVCTYSILLHTRSAQIPHVGGGRREALGAILLPGTNCKQLVRLRCGTASLRGVACGDQRVSALRGPARRRGGGGKGHRGGAPHPPLRTSKSCHVIVIFRGDFLEGLRPAVAPGSARWCAGLCARANFGPIFLHGKLDACLAPSNHSAHIQHTPKTPQPCRARCAGALRRRARGHGVGRDARAPLARAQRLCGRATDMPAPPTLAPCRERVAARARPVTRRVRDAAVPWSVAVARRGSWWWLGAH